MHSSPAFWCWHWRDELVHTATMFLTELPVLLALLGVSAAHVAFSVQPCAINGDSVIAIDHAFIPDTDYPITIPGSIRPFVQGRILTHVPDAPHYKLHVTVEKAIFGMYFGIPCTSGVGSCMYDVCDLLDWFKDDEDNENCPRQLARSHFPCTCPFRPGLYTLPGREFYIRQLRSGIWSWLVAGDYRIRGLLRNNATGEEIGCYTVSLTIQNAPSQACRSYFCFFD